MADPCERLRRKTILQQAISRQEAVERSPDGARVMRSGFMGVGTPDGLVRALADSGKRDLTKIVNNAARPHTGVGPLVSAGCVRRFIGSHIGLNTVVQEKMQAGKGTSKIAPGRTMPVTSQRRVDLIVTELAVLPPREDRLHLLETGPGITVAQVVAATDAALVIGHDVPEMDLSRTG